jgi:hypothetical protein
MEEDGLGSLTMAVINTETWTWSSKIYGVSIPIIKSTKIPSPCNIS